MERKGIREVAISDELDFPETYTLINKEDPSESISVVVDQMEVDEITIQEVEKRIAKKMMRDDLIEIKETFFSDTLNSKEALSYFKDLQPLYYTPKRSITVEPHSSFKMEPFRFPISSTSTGADLFGELSSFSGIPADRFLVILNNGGTLKRLSRHNDEIKIDFSKEAKLMLRPVTPGKMPVLIVVNKSETGTVYVDISSTVEELKELIDINLKLPCDLIKLVYDGDSLSDEQKLSKYNIQAGSKIICFRNNRAKQEGMGTVNFVDISNNSAAKELQFTTTAPEWRVASPGLCLEGKCPTEDCPAKGKYVIMNWGYGIFDVAKDRYKTKCPMCNESVAFETCAFNNCIYTFVGQKFVNKELKSVKSEAPQKVGNCYLRFDPTGNNTVEWASLKIVAKDPKKEKDVISPTDLCQVCKNKVEKDCVSLKCAVHKVDKKCNEKFGTDTCQVCK